MDVTVLFADRAVWDVNIPKLGTPYHQTRKFSVAGPYVMALGGYTKPKAHAALVDSLRSIGGRISCESDVAAAREMFFEEMREVKEAYGSPSSMIFIAHNHHPRVSRIQISPDPQWDAPVNGEIAVMHYPDVYLRSLPKNRAGKIPLHAIAERMHDSMTRQAQSNSYVGKEWDTLVMMDGEAYMPRPYRKGQADGMQFLSNALSELEACPDDLHRELYIALAMGGITLIAKRLLYCGIFDKMAFSTPARRGLERVLGGHPGHPLRFGSRAAQNIDDLFAFMQEGVAKLEERQQ